MFCRLFIVVLLVTWIGCGKHSESSSGETAPANAAAQANSPATAPPPIVPAPDETQIASLVKELTQAVRKYSVEQRRVPKNLGELVANGYLISVPPAPAGKKFAIDKNLQVTLVNR